MTDCTQLPRQKRCRGKKPQLTSGRSVTDNVNLSVSESNWSTAAVSIFLFVDAKVKITLPLKKQQLITTSVHHTQVIWKDLHL